MKFFLSCSVTLSVALMIAGGAAAAPFMTAAEVKPILNATKANWIGVREFNGNDLVYFTQIESWRCGLHGLKYGINSHVADQQFQMEPCHEDDPAPNAFKLESHMPYITLPLGSVQSVIVELTYDDGTTDSATFMRDAVKIP